MKEWYFGNIVYKQEENSFKISDVLGIITLTKKNYVEKERVLVQKIDEDTFKVFELNNIENNDYDMVETDIVLTSTLEDDVEYSKEKQGEDIKKYPCGIKNLELVNVGELEPIIVSHLGLYLKYQNIYGIYDRDEKEPIKRK